MDATERINVAKTVALALHVHGPRTRDFMVKLLRELTTEEAISAIVEGLASGILVEKEGKLHPGTGR
jgi:hypothetical protein